MLRFVSFPHAWRLATTLTLLSLLGAAGCGARQGDLATQATDSVQHNAGPGVNAPAHASPSTDTAIKTDAAIKTESPAETDWPEETNASVDSSEPSQDQDRTALVGSTACGECHQPQYKAYMATDHSRSFSKVDPTHETLTGSITHIASHGRYEVSSDAKGNLRHKNTIIDGSNNSIVSTDKQIDWVVGSGAFAKSYLVEDQDRYFQVPLTYYVEKSKYDLSPGYAQTSHVGFTRQISDQCLFCHVGSVSRMDGNPNRFQIGELSIGCERCHGNGRAHVALCRDAAVAEDAAKDQLSLDQRTDLHIVRPSTLTRAELQSLCAQCHLQGNVTFYKPGQDAWSFQPGDELAKHKIEYSVGHKSDGNGFVGHFAQLEQSQCYIQSEMTCVTCHRPHHDDDKTHVAALRNKQCLGCHQDNSCGLEKEERVAANQNQCAACHMPKGQSDVPHVAITNHRIAVYRQQDQDDADAKPGDVRIAAQQGPSNSNGVTLPQPIALMDASPEGSGERRLHSAIALAHWLLIEAGPEYVSADSLRDVLAQVQSAMDGDYESKPQAQLMCANLIDTLLSRFGVETYEDQQRLALWRQAVQYASACEASPSLGALDHMSATAVIANAAYEYGQFANAALRYERLTALRAYAPDWYNLGLCYGRLGRLADAENALLEAIKIDPSYAAPHNSLSRLYRGGDDVRAQFYATRAQQLDALSRSASAVKP